MIIELIVQIISTALAFIVLGTFTYSVTYYLRYKMTNRKPTPVIQKQPIRNVQLASVRVSNIEV
jgi:hypothetical protein